MKLEFKLSAALAALALACGCRMCQTPFDYCAPVLRGPQGCPNCDFGARSGSMFHPMEDGTPPITPLTPTPIQPEASPPPVTNEAPGPEPPEASELPAPSTPEMEPDLQPGPSLPEEETMPEPRSLPEE